MNNFCFAAYANKRELNERNSLRKLGCSSKGQLFDLSRPAEPHTVHCCSYTVTRYVYTTLEKTELLHANASVIGLLLCRHMDRFFFFFSLFSFFDRAVDLPLALMIVAFP